MDRNTEMLYKSILEVEKELDKIASYKSIKKSNPVPKLFEKIMNKFGWYRKTTIYLIDSSKFTTLKI